MVDKSCHNFIGSLARASKRFKRRLYRNNIFWSFCRPFHPPPPPIRRPIFIVGTVRSGCTLLANCLGQHPGVMYIGYELVREWCNLAGIEIARYRNNRTNCPPYNASEATETRCRSVRKGFAEILVREGGGKARFLDKNPHLWNKLPFLRTIFPDANLVITSRDIRSTVASTKLLLIHGNRGAGEEYYFPRNPEHCWSVILPGGSDGLEAARIFPGGEVSALAEYWLHTYEMIEKSIEGFDSPLLVKHREFVTHPYETLAKISEAIALPAVNLPLVEKLDPSRNDRWSQILTSDEQKHLQAFIDSNRSRIERLKYADTTL